MKKFFFVFLLPFISYGQSMSETKPKTCSTFLYYMVEKYSMGQILVEKASKELGIPKEDVKKKHVLALVEEDEDVCLKIFYPERYRIGP